MEYTAAHTHRYANLFEQHTHTAPAVVPCQKDN